MSEVVKVQYRKYDGSLHWHFPAMRLGTDEYGTWLGCPPGVQLRRGDEPPITWAEAQTLLVPTDSWWTANFNDEPNRTEIYSDMTTVPVWDGDVLTAVDLDLDVVRRRDGTVEILDEDEFAEHQVRYGYPAEVIAAAKAAADSVYEAVRANAEPFAEVYRAWLARVPR
ncbi:MAG: DUF402 domain-containing protein [Actinocatenispora sp.]